MPAHKRTRDFAFAIRLAALMIRIKRAKDGRRGISLDATEVSTLVEALRVISAKREENKL